MRLPIIIFLCLMLAACQPNITSFEECVAAGNPVMESYPRQCSANGVTFIEEIDIEKPSSPEFHICSDAEKQAEACTMEYDPVCGMVDNGLRCVTAPCPSTNAQTFGNGCSACAEGAYSYYTGACEDQIFVVCGETQTGFDPMDYVKDIDGICVEICPFNYDPFMTQIGVEQCIEHYGIDEIAQWAECDRSTDTCTCAKAYETTAEEPIEDALYRCVPESYGERLLFRSGLDMLDENGVQSVMIA